MYSIMRERTWSSWPHCVHSNKQRWMVVMNYVPPFLLPIHSFFKVQGMVIFTFRIGILFLIEPSGNAFTTLPEVYFPPYSKSSLENIDNKSSNQLHFGHRFHVYTLSVGKLILCSPSDISPSDYISASKLCSSLSQTSIMDISFTKELL